MVKIRLKRVGKKNQPHWRVVVADSRSPRDGRIIESIGHYHPRTEPSEISIDNERALHWLQRGAQPSDTVKKLLQISGAWSEFTGEAPPKPLEPQEKRKRATVATSVTAASEEQTETPAGEASPEAAPEGEGPAVKPEATEQAAAAPDAETSETEDEEGST